jgi:hypothetical protein
MFDSISECTVDSLNLLIYSNTEQIHPPSSRTLIFEIDLPT